MLPFKGSRVAGTYVSFSLSVRLSTKGCRQKSPRESPLYSVWYLKAAAASSTSVVNPLVFELFVYHIFGTRNTIRTYQVNNSSCKWNSEAPVSRPTYHSLAFPDFFPSSEAMRCCKIGLSIDNAGGLACIGVNLT